MAGAMIEFLKISSMAIFDEAEIEFRPGLNCITGETGAGKSLVLGALMLLMGSRASQDMVRPGAQKATIEALFTRGDEQTVLRREIYPTGSSRCYIDGRLATAGSLAQFSSGLITIYGQHDYQDLLHPSQQMAILEELAGLDRSEAQEAHDALAGAVAFLNGLEDRIEQYRQEREELLFALGELDSLEITEGLEEELASQLGRAHGAAELKRCSHLAEDILYSGSSSVVELMSQARDHAARVAAVDRSVSPLVDSLGDVIAQVEDISMSLREKISSYEYDPETIDILEEKLHFLQDLKRKHRADEYGLIKLKGEIRERLALTEDSEHALAQAREELARATGAYREALQAFLSRRHAFAEAFCAGINADLEALGMPGTQFTVSQTDPAELEGHLFDSRGTAASPASVLKGEFLISTNVGQKPLPLARIASGGELSRIMLAIKAQQKTSQQGTLIFDEIDSGISGQTALMIAAKLKDLSQRAQAIVVTHLHQVASVADTHLVISKQVSEGSTSSSIREVAGMDRVHELARMMGGETPSRAVIQHAKELVGM
ncbi:MAG TPA: DNA repair protein RecN [Deltaproteobacteria bacterium]|nr:DNA repair protein RecN [Deltaproteobacteria bacterium]HOI06510.1 DNA repair protein RecN [Deltaproteobacteria bacterium]